MTEKCIKPLLHFNISTEGVINIEAESIQERSDYKTLHCLIYGRQQQGSKVRFLPFSLCSHNTTASLCSTFIFQRQSMQTEKSSVKSNQQQEQLISGGVMAKWTTSVNRQCVSLTAVWSGGTGRLQGNRTNPLSPCVCCSWAFSHIPWSS